MIEDRSAEFLGRSDSAIVAWRRILRRELQLIAEGKPHKTWSTPPDHITPALGV